MVCASLRLWIEKFVRSLPFPGAWCEYQGERIKLLTSSLCEHSARAGQVCDIDDGLTVACGQGAVCLHKLQRAGKSAQDASSFLRGLNIPVGALLG